jgi:hypothetical protein
MKKELKQLIKENKLSDEDIQKLLLKALTAPAPETDVKDEEDEATEEVPVAKEAPQAEKPPAQKETAKLTPADLSKMISDAVLTAMKAERDTNLYPAQKPLAPPTPTTPIKKAEPKPTKPGTTNSLLDPNGNLVF